jgi:hypothetical protein
MVQPIQPAPDPYRPPSSTAPVGSRVRIHGLKSKPELNGREGRVVASASANEGEDEAANVRVDVELEACSGPILRVKHANFSPSPAPPEAARAFVDASGRMREVDGRCFNETLDWGRWGVNEMSHCVMVPELRSRDQIHSLRGSAQGLRMLGLLTTRMVGFTSL